METSTTASTRDLASARLALFQAVMSLAGLTVLGYGRLTGFDPLFHSVWRSRIATHFLFALIAVSCLGSLALVIGAIRSEGERVRSLISYIAASTVFLVAACALLPCFSRHPAEFLRFYATPVMLPLLHFVTVANCVLSRRVVQSRPYECASWPPELFVGVGGIVAAVGVHVGTNALGVEGFGIQVFLFHVGAVAPATAFLSALVSLSSDERGSSALGIVVGLAAGAMIAVAALL